MVLFLVISAVKATRLENINRRCYPIYTETVEALYSIWLKAAELGPDEVEAAYRERHSMPVKNELRGKISTAIQERRKRLRYASAGEMDELMFTACILAAERVSDIPLKLSSFSLMCAAIDYHKAQDAQFIKTFNLITSDPAKS